MLLSRHYWKTHLELYSLYLVQHVMVYVGLVQPSDVFMKEKICPYPQTKRKNRIALWLLSENRASKLLLPSISVPKE